MLPKSRLFITGLSALLLCCQGCAADNRSNVAQTQAPAAADERQPSPMMDNEQQDGSTTLDTKKLSEAFGHLIGRSLKTTGVDLNIESIITGIRNGAQGKPAPLSDEEYERMMVEFQQRAFKQIAEKNLREAEEFMEQTNQMDGIIKLEPGKIHYIVLEKGQGDQVQEGGTPLLHYTGKYTDGTVFGSSQETGGPITVPLAQTIPGFSKGVAGMKEGEKRKLFVHPDQGYGTMGQLPPNQMLVFEVEVIKADARDQADGSEEDDMDDMDDDMDDEDMDDEEDSMDQQMR